MNVPMWKPTWWRRMQFVWIIPYLIIFYPMAVIYLGIKEIGNPLTELVEVWNGRT